MEVVVSVIKDFSQIQPIKSVSIALLAVINVLQQFTVLSIKQVLFCSKICAIPTVTRFLEHLITLQLVHVIPATKIVWNAMGLYLLSVPSVRILIMDPIL